MRSSHPLDVRAILVAALPIAAAMLVAVPASADRQHSQSSSYSYGTSEDGKRFSYGIFDPADEDISTTGQWSNGDEDQIDRDRDIAVRDHRRILWAREVDREYVVRDPAVLDRALRILEPQRELGRRQSGLGSQQRDLDRQQREVSRRVNEQIRSLLRDLEPGEGVEIQDI